MNLKSFQEYLIFEKALMAQLSLLLKSKIDALIDGNGHYARKIRLIRSGASVQVNLYPPDNFFVVQVDSISLPYRYSSGRLALIVNYNPEDKEGQEIQERIIRWIRMSLAKKNLENLFFASALDMMIESLGETKESSENKV